MQHNARTGTLTCHQQRDSDAKSQSKTEACSQTGATGRTLSTQHPYILQSRKTVKEHSIKYTRDSPLNHKKGPVRMRSRTLRLLVELRTCANTATCTSKCCLMGHYNFIAPCGACKEDSITNAQCTIYLQVHTSPTQWQMDPNRCQGFESTNTCFTCYSTMLPR